MPHKRSKRSLREKQRSASSLNLPPASTNAIEREDIPKGAARILYANKIQEEYRDRKRKAQVEGAEPDSQGQGSRKKQRRSEADGDARKSGKVEMKIQPGESMMHFNRRVEDSMRGVVRTAMKHSSTVSRKSRKEEEEALRSAKSAGKKPQPARSQTPEAPPADQDSHKASSREHGPKDFEHLSTSAPKRLNDIVLAPPDLKKLPRGAKPKAPSTGAGEVASTLRQGALSMAQKAMLEEERVRVVKLYREMKKAKAGG
ncbi:hypothetical protein IEO21_10335 [Rhodonia placenta]|uniref:Uncharacterized protein n=1 Tax=Rhodonia placenta TaxID=104341 RepID=A0A8H7NSP5_9APHY|nr:hypothetical protein IEO21_10335 [Postia placenta]